MSVRIYRDKRTCSGEQGIRASFRQNSSRRRSSIQVGIIDDTGGFEFHSLHNLWALSLAIAGLLDVLAYLLPDLVKSSIEAGHEETDNNSLFFTFVRWLDNHDHGIFFFFSLLWFVDAFVTAHNRYNMVKIDDERRLLEEKQVDTKKRWQTASFAYYGSIGLQFILMPIGFYFMILYVLDQLWHGDRIEDLDNVKKKFVVTISDQDGVQEYEEFSPKTKLSLAFVILRHLSFTVSSSTRKSLNEKIKSLIRSMGPQAAKKLLGKAIRNPLKFRKRLGKVLTTVRWIKYLAPLIGAGNKLLANIKDMLKKWRSNRQARKLKRVQKMVWGGKTMSKDKAAIVIQSAFRAYRVRKRTTVLMMMRRDQKYLARKNLDVAVKKVQEKFRATLKRARDNLAAKAKELGRLENMRNKESHTMSDEDKLKMYQLQDELEEEVKELLNRKLLLRPNTSFAVAWRVFFIIAVLWEITLKAVTPMMHSHKGKKSDVPMTMEGFVAKKLVPIRVSDLPECQETKKGHVFYKNILKAHGLEADKRNPKEFPWYCQQPVADWQERFRDFAALALVPTPVSEWPECQEKKKSTIDKILHKNQEDPYSWYCLGVYPTRHATYRQIVGFVEEKFLFSTGVVMFLDVFVTFFTGEFHQTTGQLIPKPWFPRWIAPGLTLQLILNPNVSDVSDAVSRFIKHMSNIGPVRTYRLLIAAGIPLAYTLAYLFMDFIWLPMVDHQNTVKVIT